MKNKHYATIENGQMKTRTNTEPGYFPTTLRGNKVKEKDCQLGNTMVDLIKEENELWRNQVYTTHPTGMNFHFLQTQM